MARKGKDPAILFYPGDWAMGTLLLSRAHKGGYMDILIAQFNNGHLSVEDIGKILNGDFEILWPKLQEKFVQDQDGKFYNVRWEEEMKKRKKYTESRLDNLSKHDGEATHNPPPPPATPPPAQPAKEKPKEEKKFKPPTEDEVVKYFVESGYTEASGKKAFKYYDLSGWKDSKGTPVKNWKQKMFINWFKPENQDLSHSNRLDKPFGPEKKK